ncbi:MAG: 16S rRNA (uracil(1498)-N(3))-methyltransferase, partial [Thermodesulfovibrionia bacterium]|nr:16S rRNA (uracil(1498)-N(3))-methyltransferase [Thermodesulfovibrionia bacterium]
MIRLFLPPEKLTSEKITITGDQARHLALVLRAQPGDTVTILDGSGLKYDCTILSVHKKEVTVEVTSRDPYSVESPVLITLAQGIPKGDKMDLIIQKSTELGVRKIIPLITERSQARHTNKVERWQKIALSASRQSGRDRISEVENPSDFKEFLERSHLPLEKGPACPVGRGKGGFFGIIFSEEFKDRNLKKVLTTFKDTKNIILLIGPEGGFSREEIAAAVEKGFIEASLGPRILRTETAPIAAISIIQFELGDIG